MANIVRTVRITITDEDVSSIVSGLKDLNDYTQGLEPTEDFTEGDKREIIIDNLRLIRLLEEQTFGDTEQVDVVNVRKEGF